MFLGHYAVAFGAKRAAPAVSLGALILACQLADLLWPTLVLLGLERVEIHPGDTVVTPLAFTHYPWSHSLLMLVLWAAVFALGYRVVRHGTARAMIVLAAVVVSHWGLDLVSHRPDLPLVPGGAARVGLGLWNSLPATLLVEGGLFAAGVALYARTTEAVDRTGRWAWWGLVAFLVLVHALNLFGPPPPGASAVAWVSQALWLVVLWGFWVDRHRRVRA